MRVLFICSGNICRSPLAHALLRDQIQKNKLDWSVDSAGTHGFHEGELPDPRTLQVANDHGINMKGIISKPVTRLDKSDFDLVLVMESFHCAELISQGWQKNQVHLLLEYVALGHAVDDPYYGSKKDFEKMYSILDQAIKKLVLEK